MTPAFFLSVRKEVQLTQTGAQAELQYGMRKTVVPVHSGLLAALERMIDGGEYEGRLREMVPGCLADFDSLLRRLDRACMLRRSAETGGNRLATLVSISPSFQYSFQIIEPDRPLILSRFAYIRRANGEMALESPLSHGRLELHDWRATVVLHALSHARTAVELSIEVPGLSVEGATQLLTLLLNAGLLSELNEASQPAEDDDRSLKTWEFHDLLFHSRSRTGRHDGLVGGTYRFARTLEPPPALNPQVARDLIALDRPSAERLQHEDPPFALVQARRRSIREYDATTITARQLGEFLYRVGRVTEHFDHEVQTPDGPVRMQVALRPYPSGGGLYELDLYVVVNACEGLSPGLYRYDAQAHALAPVSESTSNTDQLLWAASRSTNISRERLQVLIVVTARFQRLAWKYESISYSLILKNVGVLYQSMYLVAAAMELAPCAIGAGDSDVFARAAGTGYYDETSVGEFLLGSKPSEDGRASDR
jgi:SagB-type dehydrogenase family enzyme